MFSSIILFKYKLECVSKIKNTINQTQIEFFYTSMTDPIALAVAFHGNLETKF